MLVFETRINMLDIVKKRGKVCELGALRGDFSEIILAMCEPRELVLVDMWSDEIYSGDVNGNNLEKYDGEYLYNFVSSRFSRADNVEVMRSTTIKALKKFQDNYFDMIYIDADHTYKAVAKDLKWAFKKIKNGGLIMGHDYEVNSKKTSYNYDFGVQKAVDEFCEKKKQKIIAKAMDGCVSYAIRVKK